MINHFLAGVVLVGTIAALAISDNQISGPARIIDGDTIEINHQRIRLWGIDAPESQQTCYKREIIPDLIVERKIDTVYNCGLDATIYLQRITANTTVTCFSRDTDKYGRIVAKCATNEGDLGRRLVANGHAIDYVRYSHGYYHDEQDAARQERLGIWAGTFTPPEKWRADHQHR